MLEVITSELKGLTEKSLGMVAGKIQSLSGTTGIEIDNKKEKLARQTAVCVVDQAALTDVIGCLVNAMHKIGQEDAERVAVIVDYLLPLNYEPHVSQRLREQLNEGKIGIIADEVGTRTLAEIIMAGHDQSRAKYIEVARSKTGDIPGFTALNCEDGPETGPELLPRVRNMVRDLVAERGRIFGLSAEQSRGASTLDASDKQVMEAEIDACTEVLQRAVTSIRTIHERRLYCVLNPTTAEDRAARLQVLEAVAKRVPGLVFVDLVRKANDLELNTQDYIIARLTRMQQGGPL